jgi:predicted ribosomally synthesized peptide with nif11-like leader
MSEEDVQAFLKKGGEDKELQEKIKGADSEEKFFAAVKAAGFDFTKEEWLAVVPKAKERDISDDDLGAVAGGHPVNGPCYGQCIMSHLSLWN